MRKILNNIIACLVFLMTLSHVANAQSTSEIVEELKEGKVQVDPGEIPLIVLFAMEWDRLATSGENSEMRPKPEQYRLLAIPDEQRFEAVIDALSQNDEADEFFNSPETVEAFNQAYDKAIASGSAVGMIKYEQAQRYWMISRVLSVNPDAIAAYPGGGYVSPEWCLPPLIRCSPPKPAPKE